MQITLIYGKTCLSNVKLKSLRDNLLPNALGANNYLVAKEIYFILHEKNLSNDTLIKLYQLLNGNDNTAKIILDNSNIIIAPRIGTISPWSSKATEIAKRCGINDITRIEKGIYYQSTIPLNPILNMIHDKMVESIINTPNTLDSFFNQHNLSKNRTFLEIDILNQGKSALNTANINMGLALAPNEIDYLYDNYQKINRNITDVELMMFAQVNSEHCRHKIFNAQFFINNERQEKTLFQMIKDTFNHTPKNILVAYNDNSSVIYGNEIKSFSPNPITNEYAFNSKKMHILMKVETHNHPTAISPFAGSATGNGGEIRDEGATGRGATPKAGLTGFSVSYISLFNNYKSIGKPEYIKSAKEIMLEGPIGGASFNNEFGRPNLCGYFRSFEQIVNNTYYGYHKPIMIAGGYGNIEDSQVNKQHLNDGALIIQIGGPGFLIGLGGGAASSMAGGQNNVELDFNSVQRSNPEMERRAQEVIDSCYKLGKDNPILSIHDVGAGGLSNAVPELVHGSGMGGIFELRKIPIQDTEMSPLEIWCNESQERYVLAIMPDSLAIFSKICERENCPFAVIGHATKNKQLILSDNKFKNKPIDIDIDILLGKLPKISIYSQLTSITTNENYNLKNINILEALYKVIAHPTVASKSFLITIGDRTVGGKTVRDQMVGKWQIPVANSAITIFDFEEEFGETMAIGERTPIATLNPAASGRIAVAEALTNIASAYIENINDIKLSANWMASCGSNNQDALLYETVAAVSSICKELNIAIPVGKDSLSMKMQWSANNKINEVISPVSVIISAFAPIPNVLKHKTPELVNNIDSSIILVALNNKTRMGASILQECYNEITGNTPDVDNAQSLNNLFKLLMECHEQELISAYHDKSDGGLISTICEMVFASRIGVKLDLNITDNKVIEFLFNEEIGVILQISNNNLNNFIKLAENYNLYHNIIGTIIHSDNLQIYNNQQLLINESRIKLQETWSNVSFTMQKLRDNPECAISEYKTINAKNTGLFSKLSFDIKTLEAPNLNLSKPKIAILREQGINSHNEMAASFTKAGFNAIDVHINDILNKKISLSNFSGIAACGGFSYGDVFGSGFGFAKTILFNNYLKDEFSQFFNRNDTFALGVCNGCQMMAHLTEIIPGSTHFPKFKRNLSEQFEARLVMVEITPSPSILFQDMQGSQLPIVVSHGEGFAQFANNESLNLAKIAMQFIDNSGSITTEYPFNPNGSPAGITAVTNDDGRFTIMMPHPERISRTMQMSWHDKNWGKMSPWFKIFLNARKFVE